MKAKLNFKSKRTIIVISIIAVLAIAAGVSAYFFTKGNDTAGATNAGQEEQASNNGVAITENNNGQNGQNNAPESNSNQPNSQDSTLNANQNDGTQNNDGVNNGTTGETGNNQGVANANQGTTGTNTGATTQQRRTNNNANTTTTNIPGANTDATTTYEQVEENIVVENPWESHMVEWTPENVKTAVVSAKEVKGRDINIEKTAETSTGKTAVSVGDEITYKIKITNNEEKVLNSLYIKDSIPEGTEFVSIDELGIVDEEKTQVSWNLWDLGLKKGESKEVSFKVKVTEKAKEIKTIKNIAYAENTPSDEDKPTKNPVLESSKSHEIVRNNEVMPSKENVPAKVGDKIEYTITVKNLGEVEGTTSIKDSDLAAILENEKATLEGNIILKNGNGNGTKIEKDDLINGFDITVKANETATVKFSLVVNKVDGKIKNVATIGGSKEDEDIVETIDWAIEKSSKLEEKNGTIGDGKAEKGDIIHYTIKITNKGSKKIENLIVEDELLGWIGDTAKKVTIEYNGIETIEGSYEVKQEDIDAQKPVKNMVVGIYDNEEKTSETENPVVDKTEGVKVTKTSNLVKAEGNKVEGKAEVNDTINYAVIVKNTGNVTLKEVTINDEKLNIKDRKESVTLAPGAETTIQLGSYTVTQADVDAQEKIYNTVTVNGTKGTDPGTDVVDKTEGVKVTKTSSLEKATGNTVEGKAEVNDTIDYAVIVKNTGNVTLKEVTINDEKLNIKDRKESVTLAPGADTTIQLGSYTVTQADVDGQKTIYNTVTANGTEGTDPGTPVVDKTEGVKVTKTSNLVKAEGNTAEGKAEVNDTINYAVIVKNTGNVTLKEVTINDEKLNIKDRKESVTLAPGAETTIQLGSYTVTQADVDKQEKIYNTVTANGTDGTDPGTSVVDKTEGVKVTKTSNLVKAEGNKVAGKAEVNDTIEYAVIVKNIGNVTLKEVTINDEKLNIKDRKESVTLAPGAETTIQLGSYTVTQADVDKQEKIYNTVTVNGTDGTDPGTDVVEKTEAVKVTKTSSLEKATGNTVEGKAEVNDTIDYAVIVKNTGNVTLTEVTINDDKLGIKDRKESVTLAPGAETTIQLGSYTVTQPDVDKQEKIYNTVTVNGTDGTDPGTDVVEKTEAVKVTKTSSLEKATGNTVEGKAEVNDTIDYAVIVKNTGNVTLTEVTINDDKLGIKDRKESVTLAPGAETTIQLGSYTVTQPDVDKQEKIYNTVTVNGTDGTDPGTDVVEKTEGVKVTKTSSLEKATGNKVAGKAEVNDTIDYAVIVKNTGNVTLTEVTINDDKLGIKDRKESVTLAPGAETTIQLGSYTVTQPDVDKQEKIYNTVTVNGTDGTDPGTDVVEKTEGVKVTKTSSLEKATGNKVAGKAEVNDTIDYAVIVKNTGNVTLTEVTINDDKLGIKDRKVSVTLAPGAETTIQLGSYTVTQADVDKQEKIYNTVTANGTDGTDPGTDVVEKTEGVKVTKTSSLEKATGNTVEGKAEVNDTIDYAVIVKNTGNVTLTEVTINDDKLGIKDRKESVTLAPGAETTIQLGSYTVTQADVDAQEKIYNTVTVNGTKGTDPGTDVVDKTEGVKVTKTSSLEKATGNTVEGKAEVNDTIDYAVIVKNTGNVTLTEVTINDDKLGIKDRKESVTLAPGAETTIQLGSYTVTQADVDAQEKIYNTVTVNGTKGTDPGTDVVDKTEGVKVTKTSSLEKATGNTVEGKAEVNDTIDYAVIVKNTGNVTLTEVTINDDKLGIKDRKVSVTLAPGAETTIQLGSYTVTQADVDAQEKIYNTVTVNGTKGTDPGTDVVKATPAINIIKKVAAVKDAESEEFVTVEENTTVNVKEGDTVKYKLTVENTENVTLTNVVVTDTLVPDFKEEIDELTPREKRDYYVEYVVKADDVANVETNPTLVNTANVVAKYKEDEVKDNSSATVDITAKPDLSIEKTQSLVKAKGNTSSKAEIGDTINYKIIVRNTGNKKLTSVHIVDSKVGIDETIELEVGAYKEYDKPYTVGLADLRAEGKILNTATAKDEETDEKQATVETEKEELKPELSYKKSSSANGKVAPGEEIEYTITVENTGYANATNVEVTDKVPEGTTLVEIENEGTQLDDGTIKWVISTINAENGKATVKFKVKVDLDLNDGDKVLNNMAKVNENPTNPTTDVVKNVDRKIKAVINSPSIRKTNIVLVLDLSSSMTANRSTRLADAKVATVDFIKNIYKDSTVSGVNIKVVTFNTKDPKYYYDGWQGKYVKVSYSGTDVLEVSGLQDNTATNYNQAQTLINAINAIEIPNDYKEGGFGTHIYSALQKTNKEITSLKDKYTDNDNVVVFIGDGAPTQNDRNNFYGDQYNDNTNYNIESEAKEIKKVATVYAIRLGDEAQGTTILKTIATEEGKVFDAENKADLINNFSAINADSSSKDKNFQSSNGYVTIDDVDLNVSTEVDEKTGKKKTFKVFVDGNKIAEFNSIEELNNSGYITYNATSKKIEWNVREYSKNANLSLEYWVN